MCTNCGNGSKLNFTLTFATCKVCELVDGNKAQKGVVFCDTCGHYICEACWSNPIRRGIAALKNIISFEKDYKRPKQSAEVKDRKTKPDENINTK